MKKFLAILLLLSLATPAFAGSLLVNGLNAHYRLDEAVPVNNPIDSSGSANVGTYTNTTPRSMASAPAITFGTNKKSMQFYSNGWISTAAAAAINSLPDKTIAFWMNHRVSQGSQQTFITSKASGGSLLGWRLTIEANDILSARQGYSTASANTVSTYTVPTNTWVHVAFTQSNTTKQGRLFINGVETGYSQQGTGSGTVTDDSAAVLAIASASGGSNQFDGKIDDFRVYNRVLTDPEIATLATGAQGATDAALVLWNMFDEDTLPWDSAGFGLTGTYVASPTSTTTVQAFSNFYNPFGISLTGANYVNVAANAKINSLANISITARVCPYAYNTGSTAIATKLNSSNAAGWYLGLTSSGTVGRLFFIRNYATGVDQKTASVVIPLNTCTHVIATDASATHTSHLYINAVEPAYSINASGSGSLTSDSGNAMRIGAAGSLASTLMFLGGIDDFRVYNRILTADEIRQLGGNYSPGTMLHGTTLYQSTIY